MAPPSILAGHDPTAIVLLGHGSREQPANLDFELLAREVSTRWPSYLLIHAYVELARPSLAEALAQAAQECGRVVVLPCFLFAAGHMKNDLPLELFRARARFPHVEFIASNALGVHQATVQAAVDRLDAVKRANASRSAMIVCGAGIERPGCQQRICQTCSSHRGSGGIAPDSRGLYRYHRAHV